MIERANRTVVEGREAVRRILRQEDPRLLLIVGPCSIHDVDGALEYAQRLNRLREELADQLEIIMRVYFEKPRTTIGWKGLINDPHLDGSYDIEMGLKKARQLLLQITGMGLPSATEFLDPIVPQYIADLVSWAAIGARTTESQTHREMASGLSMPVGFKNATDGSLQIAIDAMTSARAPHSFLGIDQDGVTSIIRTTGNPDGHVVLRGGRLQTNYDPASIAAAVAALTNSRTVSSSSPIPKGHIVAPYPDRRMNVAHSSGVVQGQFSLTIAPRRISLLSRAPQTSDGIVLRCFTHRCVRRLGNNGANAPSRA